MADVACKDWFWACTVVDDKDCSGVKFDLGCRGTGDMCKQICKADGDFIFCRKKVPGWAVAMIVIFALLAVVGFALAIYAFNCRKKKKQQSAGPAVYPGPQSQAIYVQPAPQMMAAPPPAPYQYPYPGYGYD
jgi:hypothetical protein